MRHGKDDLTDEPLIQRSDDTIESFKNRMLSYHEHLHDIRSFYAQKQKIYEFRGQDSPSIYAEILKQADQKRFAINWKSSPVHSYRLHNFLFWTNMTHFPF